MPSKIGLKAVMLHSFLLCRGYEGYEYTYEDIINMSNPEVGSCQIDLYLKVINLLSNGKSYEEINEFITNYTGKDYELLEDEQKKYVKKRIKKDLNIRKTSLKGEDK